MKESIVTNTTAFLSWAKDLIDGIGAIQTAVGVALALTAVGVWFRGLIPVLIRLGNALSRRKVAIFAETDTCQSLVQMLVDSRLVRERNIIRIGGTVDLKRAEKATLLLVYWPEWGGRIDEILKDKRHGTALVVYAPPHGGPIPSEIMRNLGDQPNVLVTNFRGRLLNDIAGCLITTSYAKE
jgi:hypothetical protein